MSAKPQVIVLLVNYNTAEDTVDCVESLRKVDWKSMEVIIVDNGSTDNSYEVLKERCDDCTILKSDKNLGFAGGNNFGIRHAVKRDPPYILFLNNDTVVEPDFLSLLVDELESDNEAGAAGGTICYYPEKERIWYAGGEFVAWRASSFSFHTDQPLKEAGVLEPASVSFLTGCMMLVKTAAIEKVGLFDERFFLYMEDAELSCRLISAGFTLRFVPRARIYHKIRHRKSSALALYYAVRNRFLLLDLASSGWQKYAGRTYLFLSLVVKSIWWGMVRRELLRAAVFGLSDYRTNVLHEGRGTSFSHR